MSDLTRHMSLCVDVSVVRMYCVNVCQGSPVLRANSSLPKIELREQLQWGGSYQGDIKVAAATHPL